MPPFSLALTAFLLVAGAPRPRAIPRQRPAEPLRCIVHPVRGFVLETTFLMGCTGDPPDGVAAPLTLRVYLSDSSLGVPFRGRLVHVLQGLGMYRVKLPLGEPKLAHLAKLRVDITDFAGHVVPVPLDSVVVAPPRRCPPLTSLVRPRNDKSAAAVTKPAVRLVLLRNEKRSSVLDVPP